MPSTTWTAPPAFVAAATLTAAQLNILSDDATFNKNCDRVRAYKTANQSTTTTVFERLSFAGENHDSNGLHDNVTNNSRLTAVVDGWYHVTAQAEYEANATGRRILQIRKNDTSTDGTLGTSVARFDNTSVGGGGNVTVTQVSGDIYLSANDWVCVYSYQSSGGNLNVNSGDASTWFGMFWVGD